MSGSMLVPSPGFQGRLSGCSGSSAEALAAPALRERAFPPGAPLAQPEATSPCTATRESVPLTSLPRHASGVVAGVRVPPLQPGQAADPTLDRMALRLIEIGFVQGERLRVVAFGQPGHDPIGVRIGGRGGASTFALRRHEAACIWIWPDR